MTFSNTRSTTLRILWALLLLGCSPRIEIAQLADAGANTSAGTSAGGADPGDGGSGPPVASGGIPAKGGGAGVATGGSDAPATGGGPGVTTGGSSSAITDGGPGVTTGGSASAATGGNGVGAAAGTSTQFCAGDAKVLYENRTYFPAVTHYSPLNDLNCCILYGMQLHTRESLGFDLFLEASNINWSGVSGDYPTDSSTSVWTVAAYTSPDRLQTLNRASGTISVRHEPPDEYAWQMGVCLTIQDDSAELGGARIFVPPLPMDYSEMRQRLAIWLLSDSSITAASASQLPLDSLSLASQPLLALDGIEYIETASGWVQLSSHYFDGELLRDSLGQVPLYGLPFVVTADDERIYLGGFFRNISSVAIPGPEVIVEDMKPEGFRIVAPFLGPTPVADPRNDPLITKVLRETARWMP